jgi:hypothetical protein
MLTCVCACLKREKIGFAFLAFATTTTIKASEIVKRRKKPYTRINFKSRARSDECCENQPAHNSTLAQLMGELRVDNESSQNN